MSAERDVVVACGAWADPERRGWMMPGDRVVAAVLDDAAAGRWRALVADPWRSRVARTARHALGRADRPFDDLGGKVGHVTPMRTRRHGPVRLGAIRRACQAYDRQLELAAVGMGLREPVVVVGDPLVAGFADLAWASRVTFYAWDDWTAYPPHRRWWPAYEEAYAQVRRRGLTVAAVSQVLLDRIAPQGPAAVVPNGIDPGEWDDPGPAPAWFTALPAPRLVYLGTLDDRLDAVAVRDAAAAVPGGSVVLVGTRGHGFDAGLTEVAGVHVHDPVGRAEVVGIVHTADACLLPHRSTPLTQAMSPLKIYEYLAGGAPIVATALPPVRAVGDPSITLVEPDGSFARGVTHALAAPRPTEAARRAAVDAHSWRRRTDALLDLATGA
jgi:teichuronic acid biosynthesis glycosyltransferase TuaH